MAFDDTKGITMEGWLDEAASWAIVCTRLIDQRGDMDPTVGMRGVVLAAATIWRTTNGAPSWAKLDVDELRKATREAGLNQYWQDMVIVVVCAFYGFLEQNRLEPWEQTRPILDALKDHVEQATERLVGGLGNYDGDYGGGEAAPMLH